jgi:hypothetical protein
MKLIRKIIFIPFVFGSAFAGQEHEHPFNLDVEALWIQRNRSPTIDLVEYNGTFCNCECDSYDYSSANLIADLDRRVCARITLNTKKLLDGTLELRGTTPADFSLTKTISSPGLTNVGCDLPYGYYRVSAGGTPYTPIIDVSLEVDVIPMYIDDVLVNETISYYNTDYIEADSAKIQFSSDYFNVESNYWIHLSPRWVNYFSVSYGFGLRYFSFMEGFKETFYKSQDVSFFESGTKNHLFGGQVLFDLHVHPYAWLDWGIRIDGGAFASHLRTNFSINDYNGSTLLAKYSKQKIDYGFFGDVEIFLAAKFMERAYGLFSYGGTLINGVAQAIPNINLTTSNFGISQQGNVLFQWWSIGLGLDF